MKTLKSVIKWVVAIALICAALVFLASINGLKVSRTVLSVGENNVTEAEFKYYLENVKLEMLSDAKVDTTDEKAVKDFWKSDIDGEKASEVAKEKALDDVIFTETAVAKAKEAKVSLSDTELANIKAYLTPEVVDGMKDSIGADKATLEKILEKEALVNAYKEHLSKATDSPIAPATEKIEEKVEKDYAQVKHILVLSQPEQPTDEEGKEIDTEKYKKDAKAKADEVLKKALAGEDFDALVKEYGEDPGMTNSPDGYIIDKDGYGIDGQSQMVPEFTEGTFKVAAGEINAELVESSYGWHIIKRVSIDKEAETYSTVLQSATNALSADMFEEYVNGLKKDTKYTVKENVLKSINVK